MIVSKFYCHHHRLTVTSSSGGDMFPRLRCFFNQFVFFFFLNLFSFFFLERAGELHVVVLIDRKSGPNYNAETTAWVSFLLHARLIRAKQPHPKHCSIPTMAAAPPTLLPPPASTSLPAHVSLAARDGRPAGSHQTCTGCASSRWTKL